MSGMNRQVTQLNCSFESEELIKRGTLNMGNIHGSNSNNFKKKDYRNKIAERRIS